MKRLILALCAFFAFAPYAHAWIHGVAAVNSPIVLPGAAQPTVTIPNSSSPITINATYNTIAPTYHGSSSDYGYNVRGIIRWDENPFAYVGAARQIGLFVAHTPGNAELANGLRDNIAYVKVRCDAQNSDPWSIIPAPSADASAGGVTDWNFTVNPANYAPGLHKCEAEAVPTTGPDVIAEGPTVDQYGNDYIETKQPVVKIDDGVTGAAGYVLTVGDATQYTYEFSGISANVISVGDSISAVGVAPDTFVIGTATTGDTDCGGGPGSCTGTGAAGTYRVSVSQQLAGAQFTGTIATGSGDAVLTVTSVALGTITALGQNQAIGGTGVASTSYIAGNASSSASLCTAVSGSPCTGSGGAGTYALANLRNLAITAVASPTTMYQGVNGGATFGVAHSFFFVTGGLWSRPTVFVAASGGGDSGNCQNSAAPCATIGYAETQIVAADSGSYHKGKGGGVVCLLGGATFGFGGTLATKPESTLGHTIFESANGPDCNVSGDPGGATLNNGGTPITARGYFPNWTEFRNVKLKGAMSTGNWSSAWYLMASNVTETGDYLSWSSGSTVLDSGLLAAGALSCTESTAWFGYNGGCSEAILLRNDTFKYFPEDAIHDPAIAVNNTVDGGGNTFFWTTASSTTGSNVISNISLGGELAGSPLSNIFEPGMTITVFAANAAESSCFPSTAIVESVGTNSITVWDGTNPVNATATCTGGNLGIVGVHSDDLQIQQLQIEHDIYIANDSFNKTYPGATQGFFVQPPVSGLKLSGSNFYGTVNTTNSGLQTAGAADTWVANDNYYGGFTGGAAAAGFANNYWDRVLPSNGVTYIQEQCLLGGSVMLGSGDTNLRRVAASASACYANYP